MTASKAGFSCVTHLCSVGVGVTDLTTSTDFYTRVWGLEVVQKNAQYVLLRGASREHHILALHLKPYPQLVDVTFSVADENLLAALHDKLRIDGVNIEAVPGAATSLAGGKAFAFRDPDGRLIRMQTGEIRHAAELAAPDIPVKVSHVVLNSPDTAAATQFMLGTLDFRLSDETAMMRFIRCNADHHAIAFAAMGDTPTLNHIAFEMKSWNGLMHGAGRLKEAGYPIGWGIGRHGPGDNVFAYFADPDGLVVEYTAEVQQVDEATHRVGNAADWHRPPSRMDQWGLSAPPTDAIKHAMHGDTQKQKDIG